MRNELKSHETAYAVVRIDHFPGYAESPASERNLDGPNIEFGGYSVTLKEIVMTLEEAQREVARLNELNADETCRYYWQSTHLFAEGGSHGHRAV